MAVGTNRLTEKAQEAITNAQRLAEERNHTQIEPEHLLYTLVDQSDGVVPSVLERLGVQPGQVLQETDASLSSLARASGPHDTVVSSRLRRLLDAAGSEAERLNDEYISTEHLLLALADDETGPAGQILRRLGVARDQIYQSLQQIRGGQRVTSPTPETTYQALEQYGRDVTKLARQGKLDPVIGRDEEIR